MYKRQGLAHAPYELIREGWDGKNVDRIVEEMARSQAMFVGPGMGRDKQAEQIMKHLLIAIKIPTVFDADALYYLGENPKANLPGRSVLTPHRKEMKRLLGESGPIHDGIDFLKKCHTYAEQKQAVLVLKGAPTWIFSAHVPPFIITAGDPGMATAGSGDVLTGVIAALLAQGLEPIKAALLGTALHGIAGEHAAMNLTSYCMTASDLLDYLSDAFLQMLDIV